MFLIEELGLTVMREREEEARRMRPGLERPGGRRESVRARVARALVRLGGRLDPAAARAAQL